MNPLYKHSVKERRKGIISVPSGTLSNLQCSLNTRNPEIDIVEKSLIIWTDNNIQKKFP